MLTALIDLGVILTGLMASLFFAFSFAVMIGLRWVRDETFVETMLPINALLPNAMFAPPRWYRLLPPGRQPLMAEVMWGGGWMRRFRCTLPDL